MADTIMDDRGRDKGHQSVLNVDKDVLKTIVNEKNIFTQEIIDISSEDESEESDDDYLEPTSPQPRANTPKKNTARDFMPFVEGVLVNEGISFSQDRVQGGRITKPRVKNSRKKRGQGIADMIANRRHPLQPREEYRQQQLQQQQQQQQQQQGTHVPIPQDRATRSGPGRIRQFETPRFIDRLYSAKSLDSKVVGLGRNKNAYFQGQRNLTCLPFVLQITILRSIQIALESMCYRFVEKWLPRVLEANEWDCPDAIELSCWWRALDQCQIPIEAISPGHHRPLSLLLGRVKDIRHFAVHRLPDIPICGIQEMITDALDIARMFRDESFVPKLNLWKEKLQYLLSVMLTARGDLDMVRKLDSINTLKEDNISGQDKLNKDILALQMEIQAKKQQINTLQVEYRVHCANETETINEARAGPNVQGAENRSRSLGTLKWLEECFTLNLDRDAPNIRAEANLSGQLIELKTIGAKPIVPARPNIGSGANMGSSGNTIDANVNLMNGQQNNCPFPATSLNDIPGLGRRAFSGPVVQSHIRQPIPSTAVIVDLTGDDDTMIT